MKPVLYKVMEIRIAFSSCGIENNVTRIIMYVANLNSLQCLALFL